MSLKYDFSNFDYSVKENNDSFTITSSQKQKVALPTKEELSSKTRDIVKIAHNLIDEYRTSPSSKPAALKKITQIQEFSKAYTLYLQLKSPQSEQLINQLSTAESFLTSIIDKVTALQASMAAQQKELALQKAPILATKTTSFVGGLFEFAQKIANTTSSLFSLCFKKHEKEKKRKAVEIAQAEIPQTEPTQPLYVSSTPSQLLLQTPAPLKPPHSETPSQTSAPPSLKAMQEIPDPKTLSQETALPSLKAMDDTEFSLSSQISLKPMEEIPTTPSQSTKQQRKIIHVKRSQKKPTPSSASEPIQPIRSSQEQSKKQKVEEALFSNPFGQIERNLSYPLIQDQENKFLRIIGNEIAKIPQEKLYHFWTHHFNPEAKDTLIHQMTFLSLYVKALKNKGDSKIVSEKLKEMAILLSEREIYDTQMDTLIKDISKRFPEFNTHKPLEDFCLTLLEEACLNRSSLTKANTHLSRLLFLWDKGNDTEKQQLLKAFTSATTLQKQTSFLQQKTKAKLEEIRDTYHPHISSSPSIFQTQIVNKKVLQRGLLFENLYATEIAKTIIQPNGNLYLGLLDDAENYLVRQHQPKAFDKHLKEVFQNIQKEEVQRALSNIGKTCSSGDLIVQASLSYSQNHKITETDSRTVALSALFSRWRQMGYGTCHVFSASNVQKKMAPEKVLDEFNDILQTGSLNRMLEGKNIQFFAPSKMIIYELSRDLAQDITAEKLINIPSLKGAFALLNISENGINQAISSLKTSGKPLTIDSIFQELKKTYSNISSETWNTARFYAAGIAEMPLSRLWNNAIGSMFFPPLTFSHETFAGHKLFKNTISEILTELLSTPQSPQKGKKVLKPVIDLSNPQFKDLNRLRIFVAPPQDSPKKRYGECSLYIERDGKYEQITNEQEFVSALREIFSLIANNNPTLKKNLAKKNALETIVKKCGSHFSERLKHSGSHDSLYANSLWSFKLCPSYFDAFWSTYLQTEISSPTTSETLTFNDMHEGGQQLLKWASTVREKIGNDSKFVIPAKYPGTPPEDIYAGHAVVLTPNHPSMIPKDGQTVDQMLAEKAKHVNDLTVVQAAHTVNEAIEWAKDYLKKQKKTDTEIAQAVQSIEQQKTLFPNIKLQLFLQETTKIIAKHAAKSLYEPHQIAPHEIDTFSNYCLHGLLTDIKDADKKFIIHLADCLWEYEPEGQTYSIPMDICLFPNPLTGKWNSVYFGQGAKIAFEKPCQIRELSIFGDASCFKKEKEAHVVLVTTSELQGKLATLCQKFKKTWQDYIALKQNFSPQDKTALAGCTSLEDLQEKLKKVSQPSEHLMVLQRLVDLKIAQQKNLKQLCSLQKEPLSPSRNTILTTRFNSDVALDAFDTTPSEFLKIVQQAII